MVTSTEKVQPDNEFNDPLAKVTTCPTTVSEPPQPFTGLLMTRPAGSVKVIPNPERVVKKALVIDTFNLVEEPISSSAVVPHCASTLTFWKPTYVMFSSR